MTVVGYEYDLRESGRSTLTLTYVGAPIIIDLGAEVELIVEPSRRIVETSGTVDPF
jgi:hypothetical protein